MYRFSRALISTDTLFQTLNPFQNVPVTVIVVDISFLCLCNVSRDESACAGSREDAH